jgi:rhodanese-related sulfurtransferase
MYREINVTEFKEKFLNNFDNLELIDVREKSEFEQIKIKGSKLISMGELENKISEIDWNKEVIFICRTGSRSGYVTRILNENGYNSTNLAG